jgi:hypothetical protein
MFLYRFQVLMLRIKLKIKKYYFNIFLNKNYFKKQLQSHFQTPFKCRECFNLCFEIVSNCI